jgi:hypothetical protein
MAQDFPYHFSLDPGTAQPEPTQSQLASRYPSTHEDRDTIPGLRQERIIPAFRQPLAYALAVVANTAIGIADWPLRQ